MKILGSRNQVVGKKTGTGDPNDLEGFKSPREKRKWAWF